MLTAQASDRYKSNKRKKKMANHCGVATYCKPKPGQQWCFVLVFAELICRGKRIEGKVWGNKDVLKHLVK